MEKDEGESAEPIEGIQAEFDKLALEDEGGENE